MILGRANSGGLGKRAQVGPRESGNRRTLSSYALVVLLSLILIPFLPGQPIRTPAFARGPRAFYVALGDSLTLGFGADHPATDNYPSLLARHLPAGSSHRNFAIAGITVADAIEQELPAALAEHPTLATVWLGYNDVILATAPAAYSKSLAKLLSALRLQHVRVFVANMPNPRIVPLTALNPDDHMTRSYNALIASVAARYSATVVDIYANTGAVWGKPALVTDDDIHPTTQGHAVIAQIFYQAMHRHGAL